MPDESGDEVRHDFVVVVFGEHGVKGERTYSSDGVAPPLPR